MRFRLLALLLVPTVTMAGLGWVVVKRANASLQQASTALQITELVEATTDLDRALADEALILARTHADARSQTIATQREFVATDERLMELKVRAETMDAQAVRRAVLEVTTIQRSRQDAALGFVTPLQIVDLYDQARRSLLDAVAGVVAAGSSNESALMAVVALAEARSAHLDERIAVELAINYQQWAPGQHSSAIAAIADQDSNLRFAETIQVDQPSMRMAGPLFRARQQVITTLDVPDLSVEEWSASSDRWLIRLEARIDDSVAAETARMVAAVRSAESSRALTVGVAGAAILIGSALLVSSSVRLAHRMGLIARRASQVAAGDYGSNVAGEVGGNDEIYRLATSFDHMAGRVERRERELAMQARCMEAIANGADIEPTLDQVSLLLGQDDYGRPLYLISVSEDDSAAIGPRAIDDGSGLGDLDVNPAGVDGLGAVPWNDQTRSALALAAMAVRRWRDAAELEAQATFDPLTGVFNRRKSLEMAEAVVAGIRRCKDDALPAFVYVDLDDFRSLNDSHGQLLGDRVLQAVAEVVADYALALGGFAGRMGGDQFLVVLGERQRGFLSNELADHLANLADAVGSIEVPAGDLGPSVRVSASFGAVVAGRDATVEQVLFEVDVALSEAKASGSPVVSNEDLRELAQERLALRGEVAEALECGEFVPWYQPIWSRHGRDIVALEALVRWQRPDGKVESPFRFLPALEQQGLLPTLDAVILASVCHQIAQWRHAGIPVVPVHVNVSAYRLEQPTFVTDTLAVLAECGLNSDSVIIELTESGQISDVELGGRRLQALRDEGLLVATDDFGQGYASLSYLRNLPIDILKLDREFVADIDASATNQSIVTAVMQIAQSLNLEVVAEGIERQEEAEWLSDHDCQLQGYLFGRPAPAKETEVLLASLRQEKPESESWFASPVAPVATNVEAPSTAGQP